MKIIFMGTPSFAVPCLDMLYNSPHEIISVVTVPDKKKGRGQQVAFSTVKEYAVEKNIPVLQPDKLKNPGFIEQVKNLKPDLIVVVAFRILPREVFTLPKHGSINLHASLLPKYRGAAPINWAIINGEKETGVTTFFLKEKVDTGNMIMQETTPITYEDDAGTLHDKLSEIGSKVLLETVNRIEAGSVQPLPQNDTLASPAPKIFKEDCKINWEQPAEKIFNFIRGLSPYPAAFTYLNGKQVKILKTVLTDEDTKQPGTIEVKEKRLFVSSADFNIEILELQPEGKKRMDTKSFLNGTDISKLTAFTNN